MSYNIIGGSDGPTSIFLAGKLGAGWINIFGLIIMALVLLPNIVYAVKLKNVENKCKNKAMNLIEQIGRYCSMLFMVLPIGMSEFGFKMSGSFITYLVGNTILLATYWFIWILFFIKQDFRKQMLLAILPGLHLTTFRNNIRAYFAHSKWRNLWYRTYLCNISKYEIRQNIQKI